MDQDHHHMVKPHPWPHLLVTQRELQLLNPKNSLSNFKKGTKGDASAFPIFKKVLYYDTFQRYFLAAIKAQGLYDVKDPDFDHDDGDQYDKQLFLEKQSFVYSVLVTSLQTDKGRELVNEFEQDSRTILSKLHHYHAESNVAEHMIATLTAYITILSFTDSWQGTRCQFPSHFKEKLCLLDSVVPDTDKIPETVRITFLQGAVQKTMTSGRSMFLILFEDPRLVPQESLLLKSTMTCYGKQPINMTSTMLQGKRKHKL